MANILYLSYDGMTDPLGQSQVLPYLTGLSKKGHRITLVSFEKTENVSTRDIISKACLENDIHWTPLTYHRNPPILSTVLDIRNLQKICSRLIQEKSIEIVHCRSYITSLVGLKLKKRFGTKFVFDMRGFWADERVDGKIWNLKNPIFNTVYKFFKKKEKKFLTESDHIVSLTHAGKEIIESWEPKIGKIAPISVIPCCVDLDLFDPNKYQIIKNQDQFVLGYVGSIGTWYMLDEMLDFFKVLLESKPDAIFKFITRDNPEMIKEKALKRSIPEEKILVKSAQRHEVPQEILGMDWSIFFIKPVFSKKASSPTKQGEIMAMGVPIICNSNVGDSDNQVKSKKLGVVCQYFSNTAYQVSIEEMASCNIQKSALINSASETFGLDKGIYVYQNIYQKLAPS